MLVSFTGSTYEDLTGSVAQILTGFPLVSALLGLNITWSCPFSVSYLMRIYFHLPSLQHCFKGFLPSPHPALGLECIPIASFNSLNNTLMIGIIIVVLVC